jgi:hypothetical protein
MTECCRFNNLVYARTLKAGSEFFYKNFTKTAGWLPITLNDVNWDYDVVFSYIMDPIQRRHKGISEVIIMTDTVDLLLSNKGNFGNLIKKLPFLDEHSASLHNIYGDNISKINWLFMANDNQIAIRETNEFLAKYHAPSVTWDAQYTHATGGYMSEIFTRVKSLWENDPTYSDVVSEYFRKDIELYNKIKEEYHARNNSSQHS